MSSRSPVRTINAFYEVGNRKYEVGERSAVNVFTTAAEMVGRYAGPIVINSVRGARFSDLGDVPLPLANVRLGSAPHTAIMTRRYLRHPDGDLVAGLTIYDRDPESHVLKGTIVGIQHRDALSDPAGTRQLGAAVHEMGHAVLDRMEHCDDPGCIMQEELRFLSGALHTVLGSGQPFCDNCAGDLELAGYKALAQQL